MPENKVLKALMENNDEAIVVACALVRLCPPGMCIADFLRSIRNRSPVLEPPQEPSPPAPPTAIRSPSSPIITQLNHIASIITSAAPLSPSLSSLANIVISSSSDDLDAAALPVARLAPHLATTPPVPHAPCPIQPVPLLAALTRPSTTDLGATTVAAVIAIMAAHGSPAEWTGAAFTMYLEHLAAFDPASPSAPASVRRLARLVAVVQACVAMPDWTLPAVPPTPDMAVRAGAAGSAVTGLLGSDCGIVAFQHWAVLTDVRARGGWGETLW